MDLELPDSSAEPIKLLPAPKKRWPIILLAVGLIVLALVAAAGFAFWWYNDSLKPLSNEVSKTRVVIKSGESPDAIAKDLEQKHVIKSALAFGFYIKQHGERNKLQAGNYLFSASQPVAEIVDWLVQGKVDTFNVTIYPGKTLAEIKAQLIKSGYKAVDIDAAFAKTYDSPLFADKPAGTSLEGYIYPETYQVTSETTVEQLLSKAFDEFYTQIQAQGLKQSLATRGFSLYQGITLASIIEKEVLTESDRKQVAQVFEKRLAGNISLGSDVTFIYAAKLTGQPATPDLDSLYNTRIHKGLPPGPIANIILPVLEDVANPATGDYLFYVTGDDGVTHYANTLEEHNANVKQFCTKLCTIQP